MSPDSEPRPGTGQAAMGAAAREAMCPLGAGISCYDPHPLGTKPHYGVGTGGGIVGENQQTIETLEQFEAKWQSALSTPPALLMAEVDLDKERQRRRNVNARLREQAALSLR